MTKTLHTQIVALVMMLRQSKQPTIMITLICEPNDTVANWSAMVGDICGPDATSDEDALRGLRDLLIEKCEQAHAEIGAVLPAFKAMQEEERGPDGQHLRSQQDQARGPVACAASGGGADHQHVDR